MHRFLIKHRLPILALFVMSLFGVQTHATDILIYSPDDHNVGVMGNANTWVPAGSTVSCSNPRLVDDQFYTGETKAWAIDFTTGASTTGTNVAQNNIWSLPYDITAGTANAVQFAVRAPANTAFKVIPNFSNVGLVNYTPLLEQTLDNEWEVHTVPFDQFSPPIDLATLQNDGAIHGNPYFQIYGAGDYGGTANISGTYYMSSIKMVEATIVVDDFAEVTTAAHKTITVDGDPSDWSFAVSQPIHMANPNPINPAHPLTVDIRCSWDDTYLYFLIQETDNSVQQEAASANAYRSDGAWFYDGISLWVDLKNANGGAFGFNPWFGFSSNGLTNMWGARVDNDPGTNLNSGTLTNGSCATSGTFAGKNRTVEARVKWSDLEATVGASYLPAGGLVAAVSAGMKIGMDPLMIENDYNHQSFMSGVVSVPPSGADADSRDMVLSDMVPVTLSEFSID